MNVGYTNCFNGDSENKKDPVCPLCGSNVYGSKYGRDFICTKDGCYLKNNKASDLEREIREVMESL